MPDKVITFYNRLGNDAPRIGDEYLSCEVFENGDWRLWRSPDASWEKPVVVGESWITLAFPHESYPLPGRIRRTIAMNVFHQRKKLIQMLQVDRKHGRRRSLSG